MRRRVKVSGVITLCTAALLAVLWLIPSAASAEGVRAFAMGGAGLALPGRLSAIFLNPASIARLESVQGHATFNLAGLGGGVQQMFAYGEPDQGYGAGVLGYVRSREITSFDAITGTTMYDTSSAWTYAVGKEFRPGSAAGVRVLYETRSSDASGLSGWGYRVDLGLLQSLGSGLYAGVTVTNAFQSPVRWSGGPSESYPRTFAGGVAYQNDSMDLALDLVGSPIADLLTIRGGGAFRLGDLELLGGVEVVGEDSRWSVGAAYHKGDWSIQYGYSHQSRLHRAGVTIRL